jgi:pimeloyl-ACP methyl ester carboxylesterase
VSFLIACFGSDNSPLEVGWKIAPDLPGHGDNEAKMDPSNPWSIPKVDLSRDARHLRAAHAWPFQMCEFVQDVLTAAGAYEGGAKIHLVGLSMVSACVPVCCVFVC